MSVKPEAHEELKNTGQASRGIQWQRKDGGHAESRSWCTAEPRGRIIFGELDEPLDCAAEVVGKLGGQELIRHCVMQPLHTCRHEREPLVDGDDFDAAHTCTAREGRR